MGLALLVEGLIEMTDTCLLNRKGWISAFRLNSQCHLSMGTLVCLPTLQTLDFSGSTIAWANSIKSLCLTKSDSLPLSLSLLPLSLHIYPIGSVCFGELWLVQTALDQSDNCIISLSGPQAEPIIRTRLYPGWDRQLSWKVKERSLLWDHSCWGTSRRQWANSKARSLLKVGSLGSEEGEAVELRLVPAQTSSHQGGLEQGF